MKSIGFAALSVALLSSGSAYAADIYNGSTKDSPNEYAQPTAMVNWSGFYVGVQGGFGNANHNLTTQEYYSDITCENAGGCTVPGDPTAYKKGDVAIQGDSVDTFNINGINSHGGIGGGRIGYDLARGRLLFGAFAEYNFTNIETTASVPGLGAFDLQKDDEWSVGARIGYVVAPRTLAYVLAAYTQTDYSVGGLDIFGPLSPNQSLKTDASFDGISVGGGVEIALTGNIFLGLEYVHTFYGEETLVDANTAYNTGVASGSFGDRVIDDLDEDKVMATLKFKLNGGLLD